MTLLWIIIFIVSIAVLVKGADWLLGSAEKIGLAMGLSPFIVGVVIVGLGTSFPELISSFAASLRGVTEIVAANAVGSNIANILLVVGIASVVGRKLTVTKNLIDLDLPLLAIGTALFLGMAWDRDISFVEALIMLLVYTTYVLYTIFYVDDSGEEVKEKLPSRADRRKKKTPRGPKKPKVRGKDYLYLVLGVLGLIFGAKYLIDSVVALSEIWNIAPGAIAITAVALGTSLPEIIVSVKAARANKSEIALGNIFGSNVFNMLVVVGLPGLFNRLTLDEPTFTIGLPFMAMATLLFVISGISRRIHLWEGTFYLAVYVLFVGKLFELF